MARRTTLARRLTLHIALLILGVLVMSLAAILGVVRIHQDMGQALLGFRQLRSVFEIGLHVSNAQSALRDPQVDRSRALESLREANAVLLGNADTDALPQSQWLVGTQAAAAALRDELDRAHEALAKGADASALSADVVIDRIPGQLNQLTAAIRGAIAERQQHVERERRVTLGVVLALAVVVITAAIGVGLRQHRAVIHPLRRLEHGVRRVAGGDFAATLEPFTDAEFNALGRDFNAMAAQLGLLYRDLERQVALKSKELVRSQRLASVGHLAAGVAHEINNPLGIIAGYGERALQLLDRSASSDAVDAATLAKTHNALRVMCDEAFRCKQITDRLLMLARPGEVGRQPVSLLDIAGDVITSLSGLPQLADRRFTLEPSPDAEDDDFEIVANDGEMKQVVMNLVMNAVEATTAGDGQIRVTLARSNAADDSVELRVNDNGRGMTRQALEHVFEPFFTEKRGERPGTGLGLSITHAIVQDHGGRIIAESEGPGRGSRFVVIFPAAKARVPVQ
jgi:two-component system, NtrC family, sensor kinase